jgi:macrolide transport system ATP-binding/permease protein
MLDEASAPLHEAVTRLEMLAADLGRPGAADDYDATLAWATWHDAWDADRRAELVADRLGLGHLGRHRRERLAASLSGGERSRLALAALLVRRPECVLLDEPTNHLDDQSLALLEESLADLPGVVVAASHDRTFLDTVCRAVVDLDPGGGRYTGGYSAYLGEKREAARRWQEAFSAHQDELDERRRAARTTARHVAHNRPPRDNDGFVYHFKGGNVARTVSRRVRDAERRIELLERNPVPKPPAPLSFAGTLAVRAPTQGVVVSVRELVVAGRVALPRLDVSAGERLLVTGANGSGKSTLLQVLAGHVQPTTGSVSVFARRTGYLPQDVSFRRPDRTALATYDAATGSPRPLVELGLLHPRELSRPVGVLSMGQQRRLALALLVARTPDLLLLDEPTNHISLTLAQELEDALQRSPGTVVVASHDRWLRHRWDGPGLALSSCVG